VQFSHHRADRFLHGDKGKNRQTEYLSLNLCTWVSATPIRRCLNLEVLGLPSPQRRTTSRLALPRSRF